MMRIENELIMKDPLGTSPEGVIILAILLTVISVMFIEASSAQSVEFLSVSESISNTAQLKAHMADAACKP